ncbi:MAG: hypothetical protein KDB37_20060 [Ilumatobacter sp.]|nr:hypothetical protein [Ilumatobacter sp.]
MLMPALAAAAAVVIVGGLVVATELRDPDNPGVADAPPVVPGAATIGVYPAGGLDAVTAAGFATPQSVVDAFLADRTRPDALPDGYVAAYSVGTTVRTADDTAIVGFSIATENDSGDGLLLVQQVAPSTDPERWVVLNGGITTFTIDELGYQNGQLTGSFSNEIGGRTDVYVYDAVTGERIAAADGSPFAIDGLNARAVSVRFWNTVADGGYPIAVFAEAAVNDGDNVADVGAASLQPGYAEALQAAEASRPFFAGPISAFETLEVGQTTNVVNQAGTVLDVIHNDEAETELVYCLGLAYGGRDYSANTCYTAADIGGLNASFVVDALDGTTVLVGGVVPDAIVEIRSDDGATITPQSNLWWQVIDAGRRVTYTLVADDGRTGEVTLG